MALVTQVLTDNLTLTDSIAGYPMLLPSDTKQMFTNVNKYVLWDLAAEAVKIRDQDTPSALYEGELRGQTERYLIAAGDLINDLFDKIERLNYWKDPYKMDNDQLYFLQRELYAEFINVDGYTRDLVVNMLDEMVGAWRLKGTLSFLKWIVWKVFGWEVQEVITLSSETLVTNVLYSSLYDPDLPLVDQKKLYSTEDISNTGRTIIAIDVFDDVDFLYKRALLEELMLSWLYVTFFWYFNTPSYWYMPQDTLIMRSRTKSPTINIT